MTAKKIVLVHRRAPGDTLVLTALVRDIALTHGDEFDIGVNTSAPDFWRHNPHITNHGRNKKDVDYYKISYGRGLRDQNHETVHFLPYFHRDFNEKYGTNVQLQYPYPDLHIAPEEDKPILAGRYWLIVSGGKSDFTAKVWETVKFQTVVDKLKEDGIRCVQVGSSDSGHWHPPLKGAFDLVGKTNLRDLTRLIKYSDGVICGVTMAMHMAAALQRPCVVLGGGREAWWWEAYVNENKGFGEIASGNLAVPHRYLHTLGLLDCCQYRGCWKNKVVSLNGDKSVCSKPIKKGKQHVPKCLDLITPEHVVEAVMSYYTDNTLPPLATQPKNGRPHNVHVRGRRPYDIFADLEDLPAAIESDLSMTGTMEGRSRAPAKAATTPRGTPTTTPTVKTPIPTDSIFDDPIIGGKFTIFVMMYGNYPEMHRECLESIINTVPANRREIRIGSNELCDETMQYVNDLRKSGVVSHHYMHVDNHKKYPVMREMFYDRENPITTPYLLWFDDDTICNQDPKWAYKLAQTITDFHQDNYRMYGPIYMWKLNHSQREWVKEGDWYSGRMFRDAHGREADDGKTIHFVTGSFWALETDAMRTCNIPDHRIGHNGGDYMIGEQLYQQGFKIRKFDDKRKQLVNWSGYPRRGLQEKHAGK